MTITINTDASYSEIHNIGTFAFWVTTSQGRFWGSGVLKKVIDVNDAEIQAIGNALHALNKKNYPVITHIYINTDSTSAIGHIEKKSVKYPSGRVVNDLLQNMRFKAGDVKKYYSLRHVKGHSGKGSPRKYVNDWCDKRSRKELRDHIKTLLVK
jgi:ribonuclease HI